MATTTAVNSRARTGRTYGHSRSSVRTADGSGLSGGVSGAVSGCEGESDIRSERTVRP